MAETAEKELAAFVRMLVHQYQRGTNLEALESFIRERDARLLAEALRPFEGLLKRWEPEGPACDRGAERNRAERNRPPSSLRTIYVSKSTVWTHCTERLRDAIELARKAPTASPEGSEVKT